ncbi:MAG: Xaa-Pro peptidase family protein [Chlamydiota bacterium]|nr:Xaa-Pro peptidase family protein [Chlamydiota bacterium]
MSKQAKLIIDASELNADLYYATGFLAPDPFIFIEVDEEKILIMSDLEVDRARSTAKVDRIIAYSSIKETLQKEGCQSPSTVDIVIKFLKDVDIDRILVPDSFSVGYADKFRARSVCIDVKPAPFFNERLFKKEVEIEAIKKSLYYTELAMAYVIEFIAKSEIRGDVLYFDGEPLLAEVLRKRGHVFLLEHDMIAEHTIIACAQQSCDPHCEGSGPLLAYQPIVIDIFPRSSLSGYYADITRTVVRGKASAALKKMYQTVLEGQCIAFERIHNGVDASEIHRAILEYFERCGFKSGLIDGRQQGFFHGTGHGVGLDIHEPPRIGVEHEVLKTSQIVTVEPGLYYKEIGGVRLEDMVLVKDDGVEILTQMDKILEISG